MFLSDLHTHTWLSVDGSESVDALCEAALRQGLGAIAITDHWDGFLPGLRDKGFAPHFMDSRDFWKLHGAKLFPEISAARDKYAGRLRILYGVELGQPQFNPAETQEFLASYDFDFVLASQHLNGTCQDYYALDYTQIDPRALMQECFELELQVVRSGAADALAHLDQPVRLMKDIAFDISLKAYRDPIAEILREMAKRGTALEINTHGLRSWYHRVSPPEWVLPLFRDLGGELITTGSDAHRAADVGAGIREARELAGAYGLRAVSYFDRHTPIILE